MQAYRGLPILTAQPERPTRLVRIWPLVHEGSVAEYAQLAHVEIDRLLAEARTPVVAGGTGLYLRAALVDLALPPAPTHELRSEWETDRLWTAETRHRTLIFGLEVPRDLLAERIAQRARQMFDAGVVEEVRAALASPISSTAVHALGLRDVAELQRDDALDALITRTRRYAAYQRKWMRRIPGLVSVNADRPSDEVADEIVEVASARQRLPAGRAG